MIDIALSALVGVWLFILLTPFPLALLSVIAEKIWFRGSVKVNMAYYFQKFFFKKINDFFYKNNPDKESLWEGFTESNSKDETAIYSWCIYSFILLGVVTGVLCFILNFGILTESLYLVLAVVSFLYVPRVVIDIGKALKYKPKTGESETIEELNERVRLLEQQVDKQKD